MLSLHLILTLTAGAGEWVDGNSEFRIPNSEFSGVGGRIQHPASSIQHRGRVGGMAP